MNTESQCDNKNPALPEYLNRWSGLYMRQKDQIVEALQEDIEVARGYPTTCKKGAIVGGHRITIMCRKDAYRVGEEVRVIHVLEVLEPEQEIHIMGPKAVYGEYVDGQKMTPDIRGEVQVYDGRVLKSPGVDYNYDITSYTFDKPGRHTIQWRMEDLSSNTLEIEIVD